MGWCGDDAGNTIENSLSSLEFVPDMTYNVFSGTLNPTQSINLNLNALVAISRAYLRRFDIVTNH